MVPIELLKAPRPIVARLLGFDRKALVRWHLCPPLRGGIKHANAVDGKKILLMNNLVSGCVEGRHNR
jgi:hypothetical protein